MSHFARNYLNIFSAAALSAALGCSSPPRLPERTLGTVLENRAENSLENRLGIPPHTIRQQMLETSCMIMQTVQYEYVEETIGPDGRWVQNGQKGVMLFESYGSGVCLAQSAEGAYILTANHVVAPMEQTQTLPDLTGAMRRILTKISENTGIVISYSHDAEHNLIFETVPAEILASNEHDIALVRTSTPVAIHMGGRQFTLRTVNRTGSVSEGDTVFGIGYRILPRVESDYLNVNERLIRSFDVGFVKSIGDPNERSDDEINYISMNTQQGNSGGPVFNQNFELVGLRAHVFFTRTSNIEDMINAYAIRDFLQTSGYARLLQ